MMKIEHIALWVKDLEKQKAFYEHYFQATASDRYFNPKKNFSSYFLSFESGARIELMHMPSVPATQDNIYEQFTGLIHLAFSVGSEVQVDAMTAQFKADGFDVLDGPRRTGDGYYESVVLDPEGNRLEITF